MCKLTKNLPIHAGVLDFQDSVSNRDRNFDRYRDGSGIGQYLPVPGLTGTGIGDKTKSARIRPGLTFCHWDITRI